MIRRFAHCQRTFVSVACIAFTWVLQGCGGSGVAAANVSSTDLTSETSNPPAATGGNAGVTMPSLPGWVLVWNDEFDVSGLPDSSKWDHDTEFNRLGWWNNELQYYSRDRLDNARVADGRLHITARRERLTSAPDFGGQNYTSARLITRGKASWTYGRFEIRAKLPCTLGTWPAIWTLGTGGAWPDDGEIDIMEQKGFSARDKQQVLGTIHTRATHAGAGPSAVRSLPNACSDFNTYHMTWDASRIVIGVNSVDYHTYNNPRNGNYAQWPFDRPQYLLLNLAVGGVLGGPVDDSRLPATMEVDWVRVFKKI